MTIKAVVTNGTGKKVGTFDDDTMILKLNWPQPCTLRIEDEIERDVRAVSQALLTCESSYSSSARGIGGVRCKLEPGHAGEHAFGGIKWSDEQAIKTTKAKRKG